MSALPSGGAYILRSHGFDKKKTDYKKGTECLQKFDVSGNFHLRSSVRAGLFHIKTEYLFLPFI